MDHGETRPMAVRSGRVHLGEQRRRLTALTHAGASLLAMDSQSTHRRTYRIVLREELGDHFAALFGDMRLERVRGTTVLTGTVVDQAQLHGLIDRCQDLGLELVSINPTDDEGGDTGPYEPQSA